MDGAAYGVEIERRQKLRNDARILLDAVGGVSDNLKAASPTSEAQVADFQIEMPPSGQVKRLTSEAGTLVEQINRNETLISELERAHTEATQRQAIAKRNLTIAIVVIVVLIAGYIFL